VLSARDDPAVLLQRAIDIYNSSGGVGAFRLLRTGDVFHVIPAKTRDVNGKVVEVTPLLDTPVTIPEEERTVQQTLSVITDAVSSVTPVSVVSGGLYLRNPWKKIVFGAQDEPARSALLRLLDTTGNQNNTWALLCGAGVRQCTLNIIYVLVEVEAPDGTKRGVPLSR
jgi:hypothetical protein